MDYVARKRMQKTTSKYLKWFSGYCDLKEASLLGKKVLINKKSL